MRSWKTFKVSSTVLEPVPQEGVSRMLENKVSGDMTGKFFYLSENMR
jgi:hypothetical protein